MRVIPIFTAAFEPDAQVTPWLTDEETVDGCFGAAQLAILLRIGIAKIKQHESSPPQRNRGATRASNPGPQEKKKSDAPTVARVATQSFSPDRVSTSACNRWGQWGADSMEAHAVGPAPHPPHTGRRRGPVRAVACSCGEQSDWCYEYKYATEFSIADTRRAAQPSETQYFSPDRIPPFA